MPLWRANDTSLIGKGESLTNFGPMSLIYRESGRGEFEVFI